MTDSSQGLHALLRGVIDYAGLFPPASLPLEQAVQEFLAKRRSAESWILNRFVIPASRLPELEPWFDELCVPETPLRLALLMEPAESIDQWFKNFTDAYALMQHLMRNYSQHKLTEKNGDAATIATCSFELALPMELIDSPEISLLAQMAFFPGVDIDGAEEIFTSFLQTVAENCRRLEAFIAGSFPIESIFFEVPSLVGADEIRLSLIRALGKFNQQHDATTTNPWFGFKLRTGGLTADAFPEVQLLAEVIRTCAEHQCRWKATAGLHQPIRYFDSQLNVKRHGFLNVLFAAAIAEQKESVKSDEPMTPRKLKNYNRRTQNTLEAILADEDATNFQISADGIQWNDTIKKRKLTVSVKEIQSARRATFQSLGSCSFDEPCDELRTLGFLS